MSQDTFSNTLNAMALNVAAQATAQDVNGNIIDMQNFRSGAISLFTGAFATGTLIVKQILESDASNMAGAVAIPASRLQGTITSLAAANALNNIGFFNQKRYVQLVVTCGGTVSYTAGAVITQGTPAVAPVQ